MEAFTMKAMKESFVWIIRTNDQQLPAVVDEFRSVITDPTARMIGGSMQHQWVAGLTQCGLVVNIDPSIEQFDVSRSRKTPYVWVGNDLSCSGVDFKTTSAVMHSYTHFEPTFAHFVDDRQLNQFTVMETLVRNVQA